MWIQKATNNRVRFMSLQEIGTKETAEDVSVPTLDWHCPEELIETFTSATRRQHREVFIAGSNASGESILTLDGPKPPGATLPVEGTTLLTPNFCLGTIDRCDCWSQRRNLIAYWGGSSRPPQCLQLRVVKDDYDFTSALFYAAQDQGNVLGAIRFQLDGGDKHPSLDPVKDRTITLSRLQLELLFERWDTRNSILVNGKPQQLRSFTVAATTRIAIETAGVKIIFQARDASFLSKDLEFYQDRTGKTGYEENLKAGKDRCAEGIQLRRELDEASLVVNAAPGFGAIQAGTHRFYSRGKDGQERLDATARFTNIWSKESGAWKLVRVISYDHR